MIELKSHFHPTFFITMCYGGNVLPPQHHRNTGFIGTRTGGVKHLLGTVGQFQKPSQKIPNLLVRQTEVEQSSCANNDESNVGVKLPGLTDSILHKGQIQAGNKLVIEHITKTPTFNAGDFR